MAFLLLITRVISCDLDLWEWHDINILLCLQTFTLKVASSALHFLFSKKGNHEASPVMCFFYCPPTLIMPLSVQFKFSLGMRLCDTRFGYLQGFIFMENF